MNKQNLLNGKIVRHLRRGMAFVVKKLTWVKFCFRYSVTSEIGNVAVKDYLKAQIII